MKNLMILFLGLMVFVVGCSSAVKIQSVPDGAKVYIDGESKGVTPYIHTDSKPLWSSTQIKLEKSGYEDFQIELKKDKFNGWHLLSYCWFFDYDSEKTYEMKKK